MNELEEIYFNLPIEKLKEAETIIGSVVVNDDKYNIFDLIKKVEPDNYFSSLIEKMWELKNGM